MAYQTKVLQLKEDVDPEKRKKEELILLFLNVVMCCTLFIVEKEETEETVKSREVRGKEENMDKEGKGGKL